MQRTQVQPQESPYFQVTFWFKEAKNRQTVMVPQGIIINYFFCFSSAKPFKKRGPDKENYDWVLF